MNQHLTSDQISEWIIGERKPEIEEHLFECAACRSELALFEKTLSLFRESAHEWSERQSFDERKTMARIRHEPVRTALNAFGWAAAAVLLIVASFSVHHRPPEQTASTAVSISDEALLERVDAEISQPVPAPMEPLRALMPADFVSSGDNKAN